jgi:CHAT domain-containing protein
MRCAIVGIAVWVCISSGEVGVAQAQTRCPSGTHIGKSGHCVDDGAQECGGLGAFCQRGYKCWIAPTDVGKIRRGESLCLKSEQINEYLRLIKELPAMEHRMKEEAAEAQRRYGNSLSPSEQEAIVELTETLRRGEYPYDNSISAFGKRYIKAGRPIVAEMAYKQLIEQADYKPDEYLNWYDPPMWLRPGRMTNQISLVINIAYPELITLLVAQGKHEEALEYAERSRSKLLQAVMHKRLNGGRTPEKFETTRLEDIRALAQKSRYTFVVYSLIDATESKEKGSSRQLFAWVIQPSGQIRFWSLPIGALFSGASKLKEDPLEKTVAAFTRSIPRGVVSRVFEPIGPDKNDPVVGDRLTILEKLNQILLDQLEPYLPSNPDENVVIVPDASLYLVPFYALIAKDRRSFIDRHTITITPSLGIFALLGGSQRTPRSWAQLRAPLVVGNPQMPAFPKDMHLSAVLPPLEGSEREARAIAALFKTEPMIGAAASEEAVAKRMKDAQLIHFATHGLLIQSSIVTMSMLSASASADYPPGAIALSEGSTGTYPNGEIPFNGFLASGKVLTLDLNADLVTLSACDTARGRLSEQQFVGLPSAFLAAGARSIVMTLWSIPDAPTADLMVVFYEELLAGRSKSLALRHAMLAMKKRYSDPVNWGAFTLIGTPD